MRRWVWLGWALALPSCSGDYPLAPTPCDDLCHATQGPSCPEDYAPAACVASCESAHFGDEACRPYLEEVVRCYRDTPEALEGRCAYYPATATESCAVAEGLLQTCVAVLALPPGYEP